MREKLTIESEDATVPPYPEGRNTFGLADVSVCGPVLMSKEELEFLLACVPQSGVYIEFGSWTASGLAWIADRRPGVRCIGVDCFEGSPSRRLLAAIVNWDQRSNLDLYLGRIEHFAWRPEADVILVDACHDGTSVLGDLRVATALLKPGGRLLAHDYGSPGQPDVAPAVDIFCAEYGWRVGGCCGSLVSLLRI